jgi:hypothetical protein
VRLLTKVMVTLNNNSRIQDKTTGLVLRTVAMDTFWAAAGATSPFDPRVIFDPCNQRWLAAAATEAESAPSAILLGISTTSDPSGAWTLFKFDADSGNSTWADYPTLGFNRNWVAISVNMFGMPPLEFFSETRVAAINYPSLLTGTGTGVLFTSIPDFAVQPAVTYSATENTLYAPNQSNSGSASDR